MVVGWHETCGETLGAVATWTKFLVFAKHPNHVAKRTLRHVRTHGGLARIGARPRGPGAGSDYTLKAVNQTLSVFFIKFSGLWSKHTICTCVYICDFGPS